MAKMSIVVDSNLKDLYKFICKVKELRMTDAISDGVERELKKFIVENKGLIRPEYVTFTNYELSKPGALDEYIAKCEKEVCKDNVDSGGNDDKVNKKSMFKDNIVTINEIING